MHAKPKILLVDDKIENIIALERLLADLDVEFVRAASGNEALKEILGNDFAIALIDVQMPGMDGYETVEFMRQENKTRYLPIIFISAVYKENHDKIRGIETGAVDFITKPIIPGILIGKVRVFLELHEKKILMEAEIKRRKQSEKMLKEAGAELQRTINLMAGREVRMAELKKAIRKLRSQLESAGMTPVADDPLKEMGSVESEM